MIRHGEAEISPAVLDAGLAVIQALFGDFYDTTTPEEKQNLLVRVYAAMKRAEHQSGCAGQP